MTTGFFPDTPDPSRLMALTPPGRPPQRGFVKGLRLTETGPLCRGGVRRIQAEEARVCSGAQAAEGRVCRCEPSAPAAGGEVCRCEPSGPGPEGASGAARRGLCRGRQGSARRDGAQQPARWGHIVPRQADRPGRRRPGRKATRSAGAHVYERDEKEAEQAAGRERSAAALEQRRRHARRPRGDTGPTQAAPLARRETATGLAREPPRTERGGPAWKEGRATISAKPDRWSSRPSAPTGSRIAP